MQSILLTVLATLVAASPAFAKNLRDFGPERPGLNTPPSIIDAGHVSVETSLADWTLDRDGMTRSDTVLIGDTLVRVGLTKTIEAQIGWTPYGYARERDSATGAISRVGRVGDATFALKANLRNPGGDGMSVAIDPFVTLPVGRAPIGAGDWGAGLRVPVGFSVSDIVSLALTPEVDAVVDDDGHGRHAAYGSAVGLSMKFSETLSGSAELSAFRDEDPSGHSTQTFGGLSLGWQPADDLQFDIGVTAGLNSKSPDAELYVGVSRRF